MEKNTSKTIQNLPKYTSEEREKVKKIFEETLNRPFKEIKPFLDEEYMKLMGLAAEAPRVKHKKDREITFSDYEEAQAGFNEEQDTYEPCDEDDIEDIETIEEEIEEFSRQSQTVRPLNEKVREMIEDVYQHSDCDLRDLAQMLVVASLRLYIGKMIQRHTRNTQEREDYIQIAMATISEKLPRYNCKNALTTYFVSSLKHNFMFEFNRNSKNTFTSRYEYESAYLVKKSEAQYRAERNLTSKDEVSPEAIKSYICQKHPTSKINLEIIERVRNGSDKIVSIDTGLDATMQSSDFGNPDEIVLRRETQERVRQKINRMDSLEKAAMLARLELIEANEKLTKTAIFNLVKKQHPNASRSDVERAINTADRLMTLEFKTSDIGQSMLFTAIENQDMPHLQKEAQELAETLNDMQPEDLSSLFD